MFEQDGPWPAAVPRRRDGDRAWPAQASAWLVTVAPPYLARDEVLVAHPSLLASYARHHVDGQMQGLRETWKRIHAELEGARVPSEITERVLASTEAEGHRLAELKAQLSAVIAELAIANWASVPYKKRSGGR
jgi:hypothetical protein